MGLFINVPLGSSQSEKNIKQNLTKLNFITETGFGSTVKTFGLWDRTALLWEFDLIISCSSGVKEINDPCCSRAWVSVDTAEETSTQKTSSLPSKGTILFKWTLFPHIQSTYNSMCFCVKTKLSPRQIHPQIEQQHIIFFTKMKEST